MSTTYDHNLRCKICHEGHDYKHVKHNICKDCREKIDDHEINLRDFYTRERMRKEFGY